MMVQSSLATPLPLVGHDFEDQKPQEFYNTSDPLDEELIELCIKEVYQPWEGTFEGRSTPDSSASPQDPFTEVITTISGMQGTVIEPIQEENEVDLETLNDMFLIEEQGKLDLSKCQAITDKPQANGVDPQADPSVVNKNTTYGSSLPETTPKHGRWDADEHDRFLQGIEQYGRRWQLISLLVRTRTPIQVRTHAQKHFLNDPELEEKSKCPKLNPAKRQRVGKFPINGRWSKREHDLFLQGVQEHGKNWSKLAGLVQSRTVQQIRSHAQKHFQKIEKSRKKAYI